MEDNLPKPQELTIEQKQDRQWQKEQREIAIGRARCAVVKLQAVNAYTILEQIRFDYLGDTAFRDKITKAKKSLEFALQDFLLSDTYWESRREHHNSLTSEEYDKQLKKSQEGDQSPV